MPALHGLIFDLDGTLLDSAPDLRQAVNAALADYGRDPLDLATIAGMTGDGMLPLLKRAFAVTGAAIDDTQSYAVFQKFINHYRNLTPDEGQIYPQVRNFLQLCRQMDIRMGICTNKQESETRRLLQQLQLDQFFPVIAGGDTYPNHKPHPDHVRGVALELKITPENCVMIGDSRNDVLSAKGAGIICIGVTHGYGGDMSDLGADSLVDDFSKIPDALTQLGFTHPLAES
jgi:phosphoglycolate phosphatase